MPLPLTKYLEADVYIPEDGASGLYKVESHDVYLAADVDPVLAAGQLQLTWTDERPTVDGLYLFTGECNRALAVVAIRIDVTTHLRYATGLNARGLYSHGALANYRGQWAGPIHTPKEGE